MAIERNADEDKPTNKQKCIICYLNNINSIFIIIILSFIIIIIIIISCAYLTKT